MTGNDPKKKLDSAAPADSARWAGRRRTDDDFVEDSGDDRIIAQAFWVSLAVFGAVGAFLLAGAGIIFWMRPREKPIVETTPIVLPETRDTGQVQVPTVLFTDVTEEWGVRFVHENGAYGEKLLPETMGSGCAVFDADGDGDQDLLFVNSTRWPWDPRPASGPPPTMALYENQGDGRFRDVTQKAGLALSLYGMGVAAADYDNDGDIDLFITAVGANHLFENDGQGVFREVTNEAGVAGGDHEWSTAACWFDYDRDGRLDLFVANYVQWSPETDLWCSLDGATKSYCTPESYPGVAPKLYRNAGGGRFEDVTEKAGLADETSKSLGVAILDYDLDGWPDIFVANDTEPNKLYRNNGDGTFSEEGIGAGVAYSEDGIARGAMGVDAADYDRSGRPHLVIGNFSNQMLGLYHNEGNGLFVDEAPRSTVGKQSLLTLAFGTFFFDYDLDGWLDIFVANGHIEEEIQNVQPKVTFEQPPHLFRNLGGGKFVEVTEQVGEDFARPMVARGAAYGDYDRDGDLDLLVTTNDGPARLLRNDGGNRNHWLTLKLRGVESNASALGAVVRVASAGGRQWKMVKSGSSYCSQSQLAVTFGLGRDTEAEVTIEWPSGTVQKLGKIAADQWLLVREGDPPKKATD